MNKNLLENFRQTAVVGKLAWICWLTMVRRFSYKSFKVLGFDIDAQKVDMLNKGKSYIKHISNKKIESLLKMDSEQLPN